MKRDKFEKDREFSKKISKAYKHLARKKHWKLVNASNSKEMIHQEILKIFAKKIKT